MEVKDEIKRLDKNIQDVLERDKQRDEIIKSLHTIIKGDDSIQFTGMMERMKVVECAVKNFDEMVTSAKTIKNFIIVGIGGSLAAFGGFVYFMWALLDHLKK